MRRPEVKGMFVALVCHVILYMLLIRPMPIISGEAEQIILGASVTIVYFPVSILAGTVLRYYPEPERSVADFRGNSERFFAPFMNTILIAGGIWYAIIGYFVGKLFRRVQHCEQGEVDRGGE